VISQEILTAAEAVVTAAGLGPLEQVQALPGGANNQVFRLVCKKRIVVLKSYFRDPGDTRDRLEAEYAFINFAWNHGLHCVAEPLGQDHDTGIALYGFLPGRAMKPSHITPETMRQALDFFLTLNTHRRAADAIGLGPSSEACFSIKAHISTVDRRIAQLASITGNASIDRDARSFVEEELTPCWQNLSREVGSRASGADTSAGRIISEGERCLSPSDFGFHNALLDDDGMVRFVDFEYAGWDDPAKMVGDFFNQVAIPVPAAHLPNFVDAVAGLSPEPDTTRVRIELLMPVYCCKWICIILNDFLPADARRRHFAAAATTEETETRKKKQLAKARRKLAEL